MKSDNFLIYLVSNEQNNNYDKKMVTITKGLINETSTKQFKEILKKVNWGQFYSLANSYQAWFFSLFAPGQL